MEKRDYYITKSGKLKRKDNTLFFEYEDKKIPIPINKVDSIHIFDEVTINKRLLEILTKNKIVLHFYNYYDFYIGTYYPRESNVSGSLLVKQVEHYSSKDKRLSLAKKFVIGSIENIKKNLEYYRRRGKEVNKSQQEITKIEKIVPLSRTINELMSYEGQVRKLYYQSFNKFLRNPFKFDKREKRPPTNMINCLISFGNSLLYTTTLSEIYKTQLNPTISFLHEPFERRFSLSLDISELFKPIIVDWVIFDLINNRKILEKHFDKEMNYCLLNDKGRKIFLNRWDEKLRQTVKHSVLKRKTSLKHLIRLECYKLVKHFLNEKEYVPIIRWWN